MVATQVSVEITTGLERKLTLEIPAQEIEQAVASRLVELGRKVKLAGFRPGKVPLRVVKQRFGTGVRQEVMGELMRSTLTDAIKQEQLRPAGPPNIESIDDTESKENITFVARFEVFPDIVVKDLTDVSIEHLVGQVAFTDVEKAIVRLRKRHAEWIEIDRKAQEGDRLTIDFEGKIDDALFEGGSAQDFTLELGEGGFIPGFEAGLIGHGPGDEVDLALTFPKDYHQQNIAGKLVNFHVKIHKVSEPILPELDDAFAKRFDIGQGGVEAFRKEIYTDLTRGLQHQLDRKNKEVILDKFAELNLIDVPQVLIAHEAQRMRAEEQKRAEQSQGANVSLTADDVLMTRAEKRVTLGLIVAEYVKKHDIKVDAEDIQKKIEEIAGGYSKPEEVKKLLSSDKERMEQIEASVLEDQVIAHLMAQANVVEKKVSYASINEPDKAQA